MIKKQGRFEEA